MLVLGAGEEGVGVVGVYACCYFLLLLLHVCWVWDGVGVGRGDEE